MPKTSDFRRAMYLVTGTSLLTPIVGVATAPILAQSLGAVGRGEVAAALAPNTLVVTIATLGLPEALTFHLAQKPSLTTRALRFSCLASVVIGALCLSLTAMSASVLADGDADLAHLIVVATVFAVPGLLLNLVRASAIGHQLWGLVAAEKALNSIIRLVFIGGLALSGHLTVYTAIIVVAAAPIVAGALYLRLLVRWSRLPRIAGERVAGRLLSFGSRMWIGGVASMVNGRLSQLLITPLSDVHQLGIFVVAVTISDVPLIAANAIRDVIFGVNSREVNIDQLAAASRITVLIGCTAAVVLGGSVFWWIAPVCGDEFQPALLPTAILLLASVIGLPGLIAEAGLGAVGHPSLRSAAVIVGLALNTVGLVVLVPLWGAVGAAVACAVGAWASSTFGVVALARTSSTNPLEFVLPRTSDVATVMREIHVLVDSKWPRFAAGDQKKEEELDR